MLSNRPDAAGLERAREAGIEALVVDHTDFADRAGFDQALDAALIARDIDLICLAGFMRVLTSEFVERWAGRMINIHPSLLPLFRGTKTHQRALEAGVLVHGCTVHFVVPELDAGPIVAQASIRVVPGDSGRGSRCAGSGAGTPALSRRAADGVRWQRAAGRWPRRLFARLERGRIVTLPGLTRIVRAVLPYISRALQLAGIRAKPRLCPARRH